MIRVKEGGMIMTIYGRKIENADMDVISDYMDDDIREEIHRLYAPCTHDEFIAAYLERDPGFITTL